MTGELAPLQVGPWGALSFRTDLHGVVVGDLLVESVAGRRGASVVWLCQCLACHERKALRTTEALTHALKLGRASACLVCQHELRRGRAVEAREQNREFYLASYALHGTLYGLQWDRRFEENLLDELVAEFGPVAAEPPPSRALAVSAMAEPREWTDRFLDAYIRPLRSQMFSSEEDGAPLLELRWRCLGCKAMFSSGSACFGCVRAICGSCVAARQHECRVNAHPYPYDEMCSKEHELYGRLQAVAFAAWRKSAKGRTMSKEEIEHAMRNASVMARLEALRLAEDDESRWIATAEANA